QREQLLPALRRWPPADARRSAPAAASHRLHSSVVRRWLVVLAACGGGSAPPPARPAPQPSTAPGAETDATMVEPSVAEARRIEGSKLIPPDDMDKYKMAERGLSRVIATLKLCIGVTGEPSSVTIVKASGLPGYDKKLQSRISE